MEISGISSALGRSARIDVGLDVGQASRSAASPPAGDFLGKLGSALADLDETQRQVDAGMARVATGDASDLHSVVLATETNAIAFQLAMQVRNRLVEAYQDVMRTQI